MKPLAAPALTRHRTHIFMMPDITTFPIAERWFQLMIDGVSVATKKGEGNQLRYVSTRVRALMG